VKINHITPDQEGVLASTRYRIIIPGGELARQGHEIWVDTEPSTDATVNVWHKAGNAQSVEDLARLGGIFDVTDGHYDTEELSDWYYTMTRTATAVTASGPWLAEFIEERTGVPATYVPDPYEFPERPFEWHGGASVMWFGSLPNFRSLRGVELDCPLEIITAVPEPDSKVNVKATPYSRQAMLDGFAKHDVVILPYLTDVPRKHANNANRAINALRQGKFVVCHDIPAHRELQDFVYIADRILDGIEWARAHPASAKAMVEAGQAYIRDRWSPARAAEGWRQVFERLH
jgi:hypothetical protein